MTECFILAKGKIPGPGFLHIFAVLLSCKVTCAPPVHMALVGNHLLFGVGGGVGVLTMEYMAYHGVQSLNAVIS